jgi:hypothetical protein
MERKSVFIRSRKPPSIVPTETLLSFPSERKTVIAAIPFAKLLPNTI